MEIKITGRLPMHIAVGIQKRLEIPSANTGQATRPVSVSNSTWKSWANEAKPVERPAAYRFPMKS